MNRIGYAVRGGGRPDAIEALYVDVADSLGDRRSLEGRVGLGQAIQALHPGGTLVIPSPSGAGLTAADTAVLSYWLSQRGYRLEGGQEVTVPALASLVALDGLVARSHRSLARQAIIARGGHHGGRVPFGFTTWEGDYRWEGMRTKEGQALVALLRLRASGRTLRWLADHANDEGWPTPSGKPWTHGSVRRVLAQAHRHLHLIPADVLL